MKTTLLSISIIASVILTACSSKTEDPKRDMILLNDSLYRSNTATDNANSMKQEEIQTEDAKQATAESAPQKTVIIHKTIYETRPSVVSAAPAPIETPAPAPVPTSDAGTTATAPATTGTETASGTETKPAAEAEKPAKKEGISKAAKGAIIGGVGGAVAGGVITKKGKGAVIGGIIGAAGGYILGRKKDKEDGRTGNYASNIN
jgi:hypothetical protein